MACERYSVEKQSQNEKSEQKEIKGNTDPKDALSRLQDECRQLREQNQTLATEVKKLEKFGNNYLWILNEHVEAKDGKVEVKPGRVEERTDAGKTDSSQDSKLAEKSPVKTVDGKVTEITYPDGKSRKFQYENGKLCGYVGEDGAVWKTTDGLHWKRPDSGTQITGLMRVDKDTGEFSFLNLDPAKKGEKPHLTTVSPDGKVRTNVEGAKFEEALAKLVKENYDHMPKILFTQDMGRDQLLAVMQDKDRSTEEKVAAGILFDYILRDPNRSRIGKDQLDAVAKNINFDRMMDTLQWFAR